MICGSITGRIRVFIMDRKSRKILSIIVDIVLLALIVCSVYLLVVENFINININFLYIIIIVAIPTGFYLTYMSFAKEIDWEAPYREDEEEMDDQSE